MKTKLISLTGYIVLWVIAGLIAGPAAAQNENADEAVASGVIEEITVTAQKRAQSIQDVNIAVTAFTGDEMAQMNWVDVTQTAEQAPNVDIKYAWGNSMPVYTIRGVGMNSFQASDTPSVGLYVDEIFQTSIATMGALLFDMERVEVIKGPQGTLFGRNSNGGAISYVSRKPGQESDAYVRGSIGNYSSYRLEAALGGSLGENTSGRLAVFANQQGKGWVHNRTTGNDIGEVDLFAARGQILWESDNDLSVLFKVEASRDRSEPVYFQHIGFWEKGSPGTLCGAYEAQRTPDPSTCVDVLGYSDTDFDNYAGDYTQRPDTEIYDGNTLKNDSLGGVLTIRKAFANDMELASFTSYQTYDRFQPKESDANPGLFVDFLFASEVRAFSQEFRLTSNNESNFNWIVGAIYSDDSVKENPPRIGYLDDFIGLRGRVTYDQQRSSYAVFGQGVWDLNENWRITAGLRYLNEKIDSFESEVSFLFPPDFNPDARLPLAVIPNQYTDGTLDDSTWLGRFAVDYMPSENLLFYGSVSNGYKGGGFNGGLVTNPELYLPFEPEEVVAFELGMKSTFAEGRATFNAAIFKYNYENLQAATPTESPASGNVLNFLTNLEDADISGLEAELHWLPTPQLDLKLGFALLDTENKDPGVNFDGPFGDSPRELANSPSSSVNLAVAYDIPLESGGRVRLAVDGFYNAAHYKEIVNNLEVEGQGLLNGQIVFFAPNDRWSVSIWGRNLTDEELVVDTLTDPINTGWGVYVYGMPRTYGVAAEYHF